MPVGTRLPTVRELAVMLSVTRLTAQNAYRELQAGGWIDSVVGRGSYVSASTDSDAVLATIGRRITPEHIMNDRSRLTHMAGLRSLAFAEPDPKLYPMSDFMRFFDHPPAPDPSLMSYGSSQGDAALRAERAKLLAERHIPATP